MSDDLDNTVGMFDSNAADALQKANDFYKAGINKINSDVGKAIQNSDPEKVLDKIVKPNSQTDISELRELVGEDSFKSVQEAFANRLYKNSVNPRTGMLDPDKLKMNLDRYGDPTVRGILSKYQYAKLDEVMKKLGDMKTLSTAIKSGTKAAEGSQTAFLGGIGARVTLAFINLPAALGITGLEFGASKLLSTPTGKNILTKPLNTEPAQQLIQRGGEALNRIVRSGIPQRADSEYGSKLEALKRGQTKEDKYSRNSRINTLP